MGFFGIFKKNSELKDTPNIDNTQHSISMPAQRSIQGPFNSNELNTRFTAAIETANEFFGNDVVSLSLKEFNTYNRIEGLSITAETDLGRRTAIVSVQTIDELFFEVIKEIFKSCSRKYESKNREINANNWHYRRAKVIKGHWLYSENKTYKYDAIEDTRKIAFESHIESLSLVFSSDRLISLIKEYSSLMNIWFPDIHWKFDEEHLEFVEISSSKERDSAGNEHPMPDEIL